eukprot:PITA_13696
MDSIRLTLVIAAAQQWEVHQMDVKNAFLHGNLSEEIYMEQPHGFIQDSSLVCRLKKSLYGLKTHDSILILVLYVDDLLITGSSASAIATIKRALHYKFLMTDMGPLHFFLGLEITQDATGMKLSQAKYARDLLERFRMTDCKPALTPFLSGVCLEDGGDTPLVDNTLYRQLVGSLLNGTITFRIHYAAGTALNLLGFTDSDWAGDSIDHKSTSRYSLSLGSGPIWLSSKKQFREHIVIWCDNQSTLKFCRDRVQRQQTKHIEIHTHYIRDLVHDRVIDLQFYPSAEQTADIFTKTFTEQKFRSLRDRLGVKDTVT